MTSPELTNREHACPVCDSSTRHVAWEEAITPHGAKPGPKGGTHHE